DLDRYREFALGASTADIVARTQSIERDVTTLHERPALLQELTWRTPFPITSSGGDRDSVRTIEFSFVDNHLFKMVVNYDESRTRGLTREDMIGSLTTIYGP